MEYQQNLHASLDDMNDQREGRKNHAVKSYRRYFEGFSEYQIMTENGKSKIVREYTDDYYRLDESDRTWHRTKAVYAGILVTSIVLFVHAVGQNFMGHGSKINALAEGLSVFMLAWMGMAMVNYLISDRLMTIYSYKVSSVSLIKASLAAAVTLFAATVITVCSMVFYWDGTRSLHGLITVLEYAVIGFCALILHFHEKRAVYKKVASSKKIATTKGEWQ